jgi:FRG domain
MQHHRLPTRLMDWTESPLVALYFAVDEDGNASAATADGALWSLAPFELNKASNFNANHDHDLPAFGDDAHLDFYLPSKASMQRMTLGPIAGIGLRNNLRIQAQQGVFTVSHEVSKPLDGGDPDYLWRYVIPANAKQKIRTELGLLNIGKLALFPELNNVALHAVAL